jgi:hypothetical protein
MKHDLSLPVDHFKKRAKELAALVKSGDADACQRVRKVYIDATGKSDSAVAAEFGVMRAQHVIAVEHGFANWEALTKSSGIEARLAITMAKVPTLTYHGIGIFDGDRKKPLSEQQTIFERERTALRFHVARIDATVKWLQENVQPTKSINKRHTSYGWKHVAERDIGSITNGVFVAAGIIAGYPYQIEFGSPNVPFGMSEKSLLDIEGRRQNPERGLKRFAPTALRILEGRGIHAYVVGREGKQVVWREEDGDIRTLQFDAAERTPFIVRLSVDSCEMFVSLKIAKALGIAERFSRYSVHRAQPSRPKGEISLLPDEVDVALSWALNFDARQGTPPPQPPFEVAVPSRRSAEDDWSYVWSKRAVDAAGKGYGSQKVDVARYSA